MKSLEPSFVWLKDEFTSRKTLAFLIGFILGLMVGSYYIARAESPGEPLELNYPKKVLAVVTAYTSSPDETDDTPHITASGWRTQESIIACPQKYPFETSVLINGRRFICLDRLNRRYWDKERWDIWVETKEEARAWGVRELEIIILP